jgi:hypothetical protein
MSTSSTGWPYLPDVRNITDGLATRRVKVNLGGLDVRRTGPRSADRLGPRATRENSDTDAAAVSLSPNVIGVTVIIQLATRIMTWM